jgi:hypothetical protein
MAQAVLTKPATHDTAPDAEDLRRRILTSLRKQGFSINKEGLLGPIATEDKDVVRELHAVARAAAIERASDGLKRHEDRLLQFFANGPEINPATIQPALREVTPGSEEELLFRYARLHWSIPVSAGYGRRLRFLVFDESNGKLMGLFGLGDPVFAIGPRDRWIGWDRAAQRDRLRHVMDAFVVGAVPPYSRLLVGKLIALLLVSDEVRRAFKKKYESSGSLITDREFDGKLALITTTSALGRSSVYNRLRLDGKPVLESVGYTLGSGEFHFANGLYADISRYAKEHLEPTAKHERWGDGWRSRREVVRQTLRHLDLNPDILYHGVKREVFVAPVAKNTQQFLRGDHRVLRYTKRPAQTLFERFRERWLLPRATRDSSYQLAQREELRLWPNSNGAGQ